MSGPRVGSGGGSSLRRTDLLLLSDLRHDGRKPNEIRRLKIQMGCTASDAGSCLLSMGLTTVLARVVGPMEQRGGAQNNTSNSSQPQGSLEVTLGMAPYAPSSSDRRALNPNTDRRLLEQAHLLQKALGASVLLHLYPRSKIELSLYILEDDGGRLSAAINAGTLALIDAGIAMKDMVCACSAGEIQELVCVDVNKVEMEGGGVVMPVAIMPQRGTVVLAQCESRSSVEGLEAVLGAAMEGCQAVFEIMAGCVRERASVLLAARSGNVTIGTQ
mmetsp:Transcript_46862/g.56336  ORF Transcript_46862/g.56336 Transcript_46862/m.56336 type:complete len:273 (+) Transcript_46862:66-884(+)